MVQTTNPSERRECLIRKLGETLPRLKGMVYPADYTTFSSAYEILKQNPSDKGYICKVLPPTVESLRGVVETARLYRIPMRRKLMLETIDILEEIVHSSTHLY